MLDPLKARDDMAPKLVHPRPQRAPLPRWDYPVAFSADEKEEEDWTMNMAYRSRTASPSLFSSLSVLGERSSTMLKAMTPQPVHKKKDTEKKKHGAFKIWHRNASEELQIAYNAIYGFPLYGSVCFIGKKLRESTMDDFIENEDLSVCEEDYVPEELLFEECVDTVMVKRFEGAAEKKVHIRELGIYVELGSGGKDDGDFSKIMINGDEVGLNQRGINVVMVVPENDEVSPWELAGFRNPDGFYVETFDTHGLPEEAEKLAKFIAQAPPEAIFLGSIRDDGAKFLGAIGRAALRSIGVRIPRADDAFKLSTVIDALPSERTRALLTVCAKANSKNCAKLLLSHGWDIHTRASHTMNTPLHDAVYQRNSEVAIALLDAGADPSLENKWGETPENIAQKKFGFGTLEEMIMSTDRHVQSVMRYIGL